MSTNPVGLTSSSIAANAATDASNTAAKASAASTATLANQNVFLQLLVAQLKNQDPSNPTDGTAFITQLAQFSELSNSTQMAGNIATMTSELGAALAPATTTPSTSSSTAPSTSI